MLITSVHLGTLGVTWVYLGRYVTLSPILLWADAILLVDWVLMAYENEGIVFKTAKSLDLNVRIDSQELLRLHILGEIS